MTPKTVCLVIALSVSTLLQAQNARVKPDWQPLQFLVGEWVADTGGGVPGQAQRGEFSLLPDLQEHFLVRKNLAEYAATKDRPALHHEDLMIISADASGKPSHAEYFDNEGYEIHYSVQPSGDGNSVVFLGDTQPGAPRFRLSYKKIDADKIAGMFEIAPPGKPEEFAKYLDWIARRKGK